MINTSLLAQRVIDIKKSSPVDELDEKNDLLPQILEQLTILNANLAAFSATNTPLVTVAETDNNPEPAQLELVPEPMVERVDAEKATVEEAPPYTYREKELALKIVGHLLSWGCPKKRKSEAVIKKAFEKDESNYMLSARRALEQSVVTSHKYGAAYYLMQVRDPLDAEIFHLEWKTRRRVECCPVHVAKHWFIDGKAVGRNEGHVENRIGKAFLDFQEGKQYTISRMFSRLNPYGVPFRLATI